MVPPRSCALLPVVLLASACTITTYEPPPPPPPRPAARQPAPGTKPAPAASSAPTGKWAGFGKMGGGAAGSDTTPKVSSAIAFGSATPGAFKGLAYVVPPDTKKMPDFTTLVPFAQLYTDSFNVSSQDFKTGFPGALAGQVEFFAIRYEGKFNVASDGNYQFKLTSDDGAIASIDGAKIIDNDGVHTATSANGQATLKAGTHTLRLDYFQAQGPVALQLFMVQNGQEKPLVGTK